MLKGIRRRKIKKSKSARSTKIRKVELECFFCGAVESTDEDTKTILCSWCTARLAGTPVEINKYPKTREVSMTDIVKTPRAKKAAQPAKKTSGWGRGWHLKKEFVAPTGEKYSFGQLITVESK